jgi:type II secretory pathway component PulL
VREYLEEMLSIKEPNPTQQVRYTNKVHHPSMFIQDIPQPQGDMLSMARQANNSIQKKKLQPSN